MSLDYLKIPPLEKLVPFPNFATVLLQHAREFPDKIALKYGDGELSYKELTTFCSFAELPQDVIKISFQNPKNDLLLFLSCLYQGREFELDFNANSDQCAKSKTHDKNELQFFDPPYVKLDDAALVLNAQYHFTQYHVLLAAQAVGLAFRLFRDGAAYCPNTINHISDVVFGILAPLYNCKTVEFTFNNMPNHYQYAWKHEINSNLRDNAFLFPKNAKAQGFSLLESFDNAMGIGPIQTPDGKILELLGYEFENEKDTWSVKGHGLSQAGS